MILIRSHSVKEVVIAEICHLINKTNMEQFSNFDPTVLYNYIQSVPEIMTFMN